MILNKQTLDKVCARVSLATASFATVLILPVMAYTELPEFTPADSKSLTQSDISINNLILVANASRGLASWYGPGFNGRLTANGEVYNQDALTAAHPTLDFGTRVEVTNLSNGRSVVVTINDRGPYAGGRIIDLSAAAARSLDMIDSGVVEVELQILN